MQKRNRIFILILVAALLLSTAAGCSSQKASQNLPVATAVAANQELESNLEFSGVLLPTQMADISSRITGQVVSLPHKVGDPVKSGDVLMTLDIQALQGQLMQAEANYKAAQAASEAAANAAVISKTNLDAAQANFDRNQMLFNAGAISQSQMDDIRDKLTIAEKQYQTASGPTLSQARAGADAAFASVKNYQIQIDISTIHAPIDGIVTTQNVNIGQVVTAGAPVISIVDNSVLKLKSTIGQDQLWLLTMGQGMDVTIDSYPGTVFKGTITNIGPIAVSTGELFPVEISLKNEQGLMAGLSAHSSLNLKAAGVVVPRTAIQVIDGKNYVYVIQDNKAYQREVTTGLSNDQDILIVSGLNDGEPVAVSNVGQLTDGKIIKVQ